MSTADTAGLGRLQARLAKIANPNPVPLLETIARVMDDDNRRGILASEDGNGNPMVAVTYRPVSPKTGQVVRGGKGAKLTIEQRLGQAARTSRGKYSRIGSGAERTNNNLTSAEYRKLGGPPLAPRKQFSRVITNYMQRYGQTSATTWEVIGAWINVLSKKGVPFLRFHFDGEGRLPTRDLRGIRPWGMEKIRSASRAWWLDIVRSSNAGQ